MISVISAPHRCTCEEPTVLVNITPAIRIYREETFGPVVVILPVDTVDEAVRLANDTDYGLSSAVSARTSTRRWR